MSVARPDVQIWPRNIRLLILDEIILISLVGTINLANILEIEHTGQFFAMCESKRCGVSETSGGNLTT